MNHLDPIPCRNCYAINISSVNRELSRAYNFYMNARNVFIQLLWLIIYYYAVTVVMLFGWRLSCGNKMSMKVYTDTDSYISLLCNQHLWCTANIITHHLHSLLGIQLDALADLGTGHHRPRTYHCYDTTGSTQRQHNVLYTVQDKIKSVSNKLSAKLAKAEKLTD